MFIKKDLRKIPKILEDAIDCSHIEDEDDEEEETASRDDGTNNVVTKRVKHTEPLMSLRLARRPHEFQGSVKILCEPTKRSSYIPKLKRLELLNLYDCNISNLDGIGDVFNSTNTPNLNMINLGRNPLSNIPMEFASIQSIRHLWLDDCHELKGQFPKALLELTNLESLRMPNCKINAVDLTTTTTTTTSAGAGAGAEQEEEEEEGTASSSSRNSGRAHRDDDDDDSDDGSDIEMGMDAGDDAPVGQKKEEGSYSSSSSSMVVKPLKHLKILCLDRNELTELPSLLGKWVPNLEELYVRHNNIQSLNNVESFPSKIKIMHFSSNQLENLNALTTISKQQQQQQCPKLTHLYVNGNQLKSIPSGILDSQCCPRLERLVVCHNPPLSELPNDLWEHIHSSQKKEGDEEQEEQGGSNKNKKECKVVWEPNPNILVVPGPTNL